MYSRPALLLLVVGLRALSVLSEPIPTVLSTEARRDAKPPARLESVTVLGRQTPDPGTCPTVRCAAGTRPVYHEGQTHCSCEPADAPCSNSIYCGAGAIKTFVANRDYCQCEAVPGTETCPLMKCRAGNHVVYHPETSKCGCDPDCPGLYCIATHVQFYNSTSRACSCEPIGGFEEITYRDADTANTADTADAEAAEAITTRTSYKITYTGPYTKRAEDVTSTTLATATSTPLPPIIIGPSCGKTICISEMHGVYNATSKRCECKWIPGLEPGGPFLSARETTLVTATTVAPPATVAPLLPTPAVGLCTEIYCISEMHPVYSATLGYCTCVWIDGFGPESI